MALGLLVGWMALASACEVHLPGADLERLDTDGGLPEGKVFSERGAGFAQKVAAFQPASPASYGHEDFPTKILGPPKGSGQTQGSLDVVSLGCGGEITLEFSAPLIADGPGPDFVIFENAFSSGGPTTFAEPAEVSVSVDGKTWRTFPCEPKGASWPLASCAGIRPVFASPETALSPYDPAKAGGDAFDLADLGLSFARFVRIRDKSAEYRPASSWCQSHNAGFDLDAVAVIWGVWPSEFSKR